MSVYGLTSFLHRSLIFPVVCVLGATLVPLYALGNGHLGYALRHLPKVLQNLFYRMYI